MSFPKRCPVKSFKGLLELSFFKHPQDCVLPFKKTIDTHECDITAFALTYP